MGMINVQGISNYQWAIEVLGIGNWEFLGHWSLVISSEAHCTF